MQTERREQLPVVREPVSFIQLKGEPYCRTVNSNGHAEDVNCSHTANSLSEVSGYYRLLEDKVNDSLRYLKPLFDGGYSALDKKIKNRENLTFDESFSLITLVCSALNRPLRNIIENKIKEYNKTREEKIDIFPLETDQFRAVSLLQGMSVKESYGGLTAPEIAGCVAAALHLDTFVRVDHGVRYLIVLGGMGGDKGYEFRQRDSKLFSLSTLAAIGLSVDVPVHKHHSYPNTSKVAGQSAIEEMGARSDFHTPQAMRNVIDQTGLLMSSCHDTRTLHTLSHILKGETINHVIGPLSFPINADTPTGALIGVNHNIHPNTMVEAIKDLQEAGFQQYVNAAVFCGTDLQEINSLEANSGLVDNSLFRDHVKIDELAPPPYASIISFLRNEQNLGAFILKPEDFFGEAHLKDMNENLHKLFIPNEKDQILNANQAAISGADEVKARYLAMTVGLGLFISSKLSLADSLDLETRTVNRAYLRECTQRALDIIHLGDAQRQQEAYVAATIASAGKK